MTTLTPHHSPAALSERDDGGLRSVWSLEILRGTAALQATRDPQALREWETLACAAPHVALFQGPAFVRAWYETYGEALEPVLCFGRAAAGDVVGVLPLALSPGTGRPMFAGGHHCEYAGWLCAPGLREEFPARVVAQLHDMAILRSHWDWGWLAPGIGTGWLGHPALHARGIVALTSDGTTPVLGVQEPGRPRFFDASGKNYKRKLNRLKRLGPVKLLRLDADDLTDDFWRRLVTTYDVRTLARYGSAPFTEDPLKEPFHRRLVEHARNAALLYVLRAGNEGVGFYFALADRRRAIYCLAGFDHRQVQASPGKLLADLVADDLAVQGFERLDQTPGGDPYKEEVATTHEPLTRLHLFPSRASARAHEVGRTARTTTKKVALAMGFPVERQRAAVRFLRGAAADRSVLQLVEACGRAARKWVWSRQAMVLFRVHREPLTKRHGPVLAPDCLFRMDHLEDFLLYADSNRWGSRQAIMADAIDRIRGGEHCYTVVEDGVLLHYGWINPRAEEVHLTEVDRRVPLPDGSALVYNGYTEPRVRGQGLHTRSLAHRVAECFRLGANSVTTAVLESNASSLQNIGRVFGPPVGRVVQVTHLGRARSRQEPA